MIFEPDCLKTLFRPRFDSESRLSDMCFSSTVSRTGVLGLDCYFKRFLALKSDSEVLLSRVTKSIFGRIGFITGDMLSNLPTLTKVFLFPKVYELNCFLEELELGFLLA